MNRFLTMLFVCALLPLTVWAEDANIRADKALAAQGNNAFAFDLYAQLRSQSGNLFLSPLSISTALAMAYGGARNVTAAEMAKTLHFELAPDRLHPAMAQLLGDLNAQGKTHSYQLTLANALWFQKGFAFQSDFIKLIKNHYHAGLNDVDFIGNAETARLTINDWIDRQTVHKIINLIPQGALNQRTRLVLTNAVYFKGDWLAPFKKTDTHDEDFYVAKNQPHTARMMHRTGTFNYFDGGTFQALEIPYVKNDLSMILFLPAETDGLSALEQNMTAVRMQDWMGSLRSRHDIQLALPKFKMEAQFELADTLQAMGMKEAFTGSADFSGMTGQRALSISRVIHKAYADVNEEGTEAAAATAVVMPSLAAMAPASPPVVFRADHPFLFLIRDNTSGSILFMGRVSDPSRPI